MTQLRSKIKMSEQNNFYRRKCAKKQRFLIKKLKTELNNVKTMNTIRKEITEKYIKKKNEKGLIPINNGHSLANRQRYNGYLELQNRCIFGEGISTKLIKGDTFDHDLLIKNPLAVSQNNGIELSLAGIQSYKWKTVRFVNRFTINILCCLRVTDEILHKSSNISIEYYLYTLISYVHKHINNDIVYDLSINNFYITVNKILNYLKNNNYTNTAEKTAIYKKKMQDKFDVFLNSVDTDVFYKNVILIYVKTINISQSVHYNNIKNLKSNLTSRHLYNKMVTAYEKMLSELYDYEPMVKLSEINNIENSVVGVYMREIAERYNPLPEIEIFSDGEESIVQMRKFEKKKLNGVQMGEKWKNRKDTNEKQESTLIDLSSDLEYESDNSLPYNTIKNVKKNKKEDNTLILSSNAEGDTNPNTSTKHEKLNEYNIDSMKQCILTKITNHNDDHIIDGDLRISELKKLTTNNNYWFNDSVINTFSKILNLRRKDCYIADTFLISQLSKRKLSNRQLSKIDYKSRKLFFMPVNVNGNHWVLYVLSPNDKSVKFYNSFENMNTKKQIPYENIIKQFLNTIDPDVNYIITTPKCPQQENYNDCGVFVCMFIDTLIGKSDIITIEASKTTLYRQYIAYEISKLL